MDDMGQSVNMDRIKSLSFEMGPIRPPSEGGSLSLLLRITRNCPWSRCTFCYGNFYNRERFSLRTVSEIKADIDNVKSICDEIKALSWKLGFDGKIAQLAKELPKLLLAEKELKDLSQEEATNIHCVINAYNWLATGTKNVFLQDADTLIMYTDQLVEVLRYLKWLFPGIERITSYARTKTIARKSPEELKALREAGLGRLHVGLETGDNELLAYINKGVTSEEHIKAGKQAMEAGFELSLYVMPGLGGVAFSAQHAINTASVLNKINPDFIRMRPLVPREGTPILEAYRSGEFKLTSPHERLREIRTMVENLNVTSRVSFDHINNTLLQYGENLIPLFRRDYDGYKFPEEKDKVMELIEEGLRLDEKAFLDVKVWAGKSGA